MDPRQPPSETDAKTQSHAIPVQPPPPPPVRRYPKPPALLPWLALLTFKPEAWPAAARYPSRYTFAPLILVIVLAAAIIGIADGARFSAGIATFANRFPPMEINSQGVLKPKTPLADPLRVSFDSLHIILDPMKTLTPDSLRTSNVVLITDRDIVLPGVDRTWPLTNFTYMGWPLPPKGKTTTIDSATLKAAAPRLGLLLGFSTGFLQLIGDVFWSLLILIFLCPLITLTAGLGLQRLILPKRAAYRMAAAILIPLLLFNALMHVLGYPIADALGGQWTWLFWFFAASALAIWTGIMARHMYGPPTRKMPRQS